MNTLSNPLVRWEEYRPFSLGLEQAFKQLDAYASTGTSFPPYNIKVVSDTEQVLEVALAGYQSEALEVAVERGTLTISARKLESEEEDTATYSHRGVARRSFAKNWKLGENAVVGDVTFKNGLLCVPISIAVPEEHKRKLLPIL